MEMICPSSPSVDAARDLKYCPTEAHQLSMPQAAPRTVQFAPRPKPRSGDDSYLLITINYSCYNSIVQ